MKPTLNPYTAPLFCTLLIAWFSACTPANPPQSVPEAMPTATALVATKPDPTITPISLQESQALADDLTKAPTLQATYQALYNKTQCPEGANNDAAFVKIQGMKDALRNMAGDIHGNLTKFKAWAEAGSWAQFGPRHNHYDWWMFPIDRATDQKKLAYSVYRQDIADLKADTAWLQDYRLGAILLMQAWGWDVKNQQRYDHPAPGQQWNNWPVRLGKMANSLILFEQWDLYASLAAYVILLRSEGVIFEDWILAYFP